MIFLFLLIAGAFAANDLEFDLDLVESEDYDTVEEEYGDVDVEMRNLQEDMEELDDESRAVISDFCASLSPEKADEDVVCQTLGRK